MVIRDWRKRKSTLILNAIVGSVKFVLRVKNHKDARRIAKNLVGQYKSHFPQGPGDSISFYVFVTLDIRMIRFMNSMEHLDRGIRKRVIIFRDLSY